MEIVLVLAAFTAFTVFKSREQKRRIALLASYLGRYDIEKLMETLMDGYLRALGEGSAERQAQVWEHLHAQEDKLRDQFQQFAAAFADVWADKLFPAQAFDLRHALQIHARGIDAAVSNVRQDAPKDRAFTLTAELMLMQHTCHWFCRSKNVASARLLARHQTHYHQVLAAVSEKTRMQYTQLIQHKA
jgi:aconitase B